MNKMSFYLGIEDFERKECSIPIRKDDNKEKNDNEIFKCNSKEEGEKYK